MELRPGERVDELGRAGLRIIQHPGRFPFALDPVILASFVSLGQSGTAERVLDLGTGTGVIPILLCGRYPLIHVTGVEIQPDTVDMASRSVALNQLEDRIRILLGDYRSLDLQAGSFDLVTMNPPYREAGTGRISPNMARAVSRHELTGSLADVVRSAARQVRYRGKVTAVFLAERLPDLLYTLRIARLEPKRMRMVHSRADQSAKLVLIEAVKGGGKGLTTEPPLIIYTRDGEYTPEMRQIYVG